MCLLNTSMNGWIRTQLCNEFRRDHGEGMMCLPPSSSKRYLHSRCGLSESLHDREQPCRVRPDCFRRSGLSDGLRRTAPSRHESRGPDDSGRGISCRSSGFAGRYRSGFRRSHRYGPIHWLVRGKASRRDSSRQRSARFSSWLFIE
jgi:hypothetical protein